MQCLMEKFLSTLSLRRATGFGAKKCAEVVISIHALLAESDVRFPNKLSHSPLFLSTLSLRRATGCTRPSMWGDAVFLSTLSLRRATVPDRQPAEEPAISIHALLAESDMAMMAAQQLPMNFYPRSPCGERRFLRMGSTAETPFLSTLSLRRATDQPPGLCMPHMISIHALLAESDSADFVEINDFKISIHALLAESDAAKTGFGVALNDFYPRSPCGERRTDCFGVSLICNFYPRSPCGERRAARTALPMIEINFYPRSPCGERHCGYTQAVPLVRISIHALLAESDPPDHPPGIACPI